jgi:paraquat-inducible protein A
VKTAASLNMVACAHCAKLWNAVEAGERCGCCGAKLHMRKPNSLRRTWAFVIAACILYLPANMLPVMITSTFPGEEQHDTIMSGIIYFWISGSWAVAAVIFIASFVVPLFKLAVMILLLITVQRRSRWQLLQRTRLYRLVDLIGRWSMLDVFVVSLLSGLVQIRGFAEIHPGPGIAVFAAVVILTMLASMSFDPRLIWDAAGRDAGEPDSGKSM